MSMHDTPSATNTPGAGMTGGMSGGTSSAEQSPIKEKAGQAAEQASATASTAAEGAKHVAGEAKQQVQAVAGEAKNQVQQIVGRTKDEIQQQADQRNRQAAEGLRSMSTSINALLQGRPEQASQITGYLQQAQTKIDTFAQQLEQRGPQGVLEDVTRFARRKPGLFLLGAIGAGFAVGRVVRAGAAAAQDQQDQQQYQPGQLGTSAGYGYELDPPTGDALDWTPTAAPVGAGMSPGTTGLGQEEWR